MKRFFHGVEYRCTNKMADRDMLGGNELIGSSPEKDHYA
jgi:hypothetical protein